MTTNVGNLIVTLGKLCDYELDVVCRAVDRLLADRNERQHIEALLAGSDAAMMKWASFYHWHDDKRKGCPPVVRAGVYGDHRNTAGGVWGCQELLCRFGTVGHEYVDDP